MLCWLYENVQNGGRYPTKYRVNLSVGPYRRDLVIIVSVNGPVPNDTRTSADTVLTANLDMFSATFPRSVSNDISVTW